MITMIYTDQLLKYPLTKKEFKKIEELWEFIRIFRKTYIFVSDYRRAVIRKVRQRYTAYEYYELEKILDKMFWNLRWLVYPLFMNEEITQKEYMRVIKNNYGRKKEIPELLLQCKRERYTNADDLERKMKLVLTESYYRSFINKLVMINASKKEVSTKRMEGSSDIFEKNEFNLLTMTILFNRDVYERVMKNPLLIREEKIELPEHYTQQDYGFPNMNLCTYNFGSERQRMNRIEKMYYSINPKSQYWFRLIK